MKRQDCLSAGAFWHTLTRRAQSLDFGSRNVRCYVGVQGPSRVEEKDPAGSS